jgi:hypothetical protein
VKPTVSIAAKRGLMKVETGVGEFLARLLYDIAVFSLKYLKWFLYCYLEKAKSNNAPMG